MANMNLSITNSKGRLVSLLNDDIQQHQQFEDRRKAAKRRYYCTEPGCHKSFTTSGHLARHNRIHTGEKNFQCPQPGCPSRFSRHDNMMQHYRTHLSYRSRQHHNSRYIECRYTYYQPDTMNRQQALIAISDIEQHCFLQQHKGDIKRDTTKYTTAGLPRHDISVMPRSIANGSKSPAVTNVNYPSPPHQQTIYNASTAVYNPANSRSLPQPQQRAVSPPFVRDMTLNWKVEEKSVQDSQYGPNR